MSIFCRNNTISSLSKQTINGITIFISMFHKNITEIILLGLKLKSTIFSKSCSILKNLHHSSKKTTINNIRRLITKRIERIILYFNKRMIYKKIRQLNSNLFLLFSHIIFSINTLSINSFRKAGSRNTSSHHFILLCFKFSIEMSSFRYSTKHRIISSLTFDRCFNSRSSIFKKSIQIFNTINNTIRIFMMINIVYNRIFINIRIIMFKNLCNFSNSFLRNTTSSIFLNIFLIIFDVLSSFINKLLIIIIILSRNSSSYSIK